MFPAVFSQLVLSVAEFEFRLLQFSITVIYHMNL